MGRSTGPRSPSRPCGAACSGAGAARSEPRRHSESFRVIRDGPGHSESFRVVRARNRQREMDGGPIGCGRLGVGDAASPSRSDLLLARGPRARLGSTAAHPSGTARKGSEWHGMARNGWTGASVTERPGRTRNGRAGARGRRARKSRLRDPSWTPGRVLPAPLCRVRAGPV